MYASEMERCPRCERPVAADAAFCQHCGAQLRIQPVRGEIVDGTKRFARNKPISPGRAARLSLIPGLGHWYAGAPVKGLAFFAAIVGPIVIGTELDLTAIGAILGIPLDLGGIGLWGFCAYDAYRTARKRMRPAA
ncbi:MAG TPA: zinc ribbon domain-containing protein [Candidatus Dormibacteraeota bacterium]|nr:zinc ribbon domain-containing protein [Candidatus Dormibacteraeota bacterium]